MAPSYLDIAAPMFAGAGLTLALTVAGAVFAGIRKKGSLGQGFWAAVSSAEGDPPSFRDRMILSGITLLVTGFLMAALYAWTIGFGGFSGRVQKKSVTSLGKYGDYTLQVDGETFRVSREVYRAAEMGSRVRRPWWRTYVTVEEKPYIRAVPLAAFGAMGTLLAVLCAAILFLCWLPGQGRRQSG